MNDDKKERTQAGKRIKKFELINKLQWDRLKPVLLGPC
jgi:hypothetical protein